MGKMSFRDYLKTKTFMKAFVKGPPGSGKTFLASAASQVWKTLYIDVEGGLSSGSRVADYEKIEVFPIMGEEMEDPNKFFDALAEAMAEAESGNYECVVLDSFTEISGRIEDDYAAKSASGRLEFGDWSVLLHRVRRLAHRLRNLSCHTIVTSLTKPTGKEDASAIFEPAISGQGAAVVPSFFETVGLMRKVMEKKELHYYFTTDGPSIYQVRDRFRVLAPDERVTEGEAYKVWEKLSLGVQSVAASPGPASVPVSQ